MDDDDGLAVVRPTRWKTRDDPSEATGGTLSLGSRDDDDADDDDVNVDDVSREWDERVVREDDAAFDRLLDLTEGAMRSVRVRASPAKPEPRETKDDDDGGDGSESDARAAATERDAGVETRTNSDVSESDAFDLRVDDAETDEPGDASAPAAEPARPRRSPARREAEARPTRVSGRTRLGASRPDPRSTSAKAWLSEFAALSAKQRAAERALVGALGDDRETERAAARRRLRDDLFARLERVRGGARALAARAADARGGEAHALELGRLVDDAERDIIALKEAQKAAYDGLAREERHLTRHCDDFASRLETWDADASDPVWAGVPRRSPNGGRRNAGRGRRVYGAPPPERAEPWSRGASASRKDGTRPASARTAKTGVPRTSSASSADVAPAETRKKPPGGPGPWARAASARSPGETRSASPSSASAKSASAQKAAAAAARRAPPPPAVAEYDDFIEEYGSTGGWADVDHARWRRCLARCNMHYAAATAMAAEDLAPFGIERAEVARHARWDAEREHLCAKKRAAVRAWRAAQTAAAKGTRDALDAETARVEEEERAKAAAKAAAVREREKAALREWRLKKREQDEAVREAAREAAARAEASEAERRKRLRLERAERDKRNALRALEREELRDAARAAAEAAAEALIPSAPKMSAADARAERERLAARALAAAARKREAAAAKKGEPEKRAARQKALAAKARERQRVAEGKTLASLEDPGRLTRATASHALRVASERDAGGLFSAAPAVQYLSHKATPSWRATR